MTTEKCYTFDDLDKEVQDRLIKEGIEILIHPSFKFKMEDYVRARIKDLGAFYTKEGELLEISLMSMLSSSDC